MEIGMDRGPFGSLPPYLQALGLVSLGFGVPAEEGEGLGF